MKFNVHRNQILQKVQFINSIVPVRNPLQILTNILLEANGEKGKIRLAATDLEVSAVTEVECNVLESGKIAIPAKNFTDIIRALPDDEIQCELDNKMLNIKCQHSEFSLIYADPEDFPEIPEREWENSFTMDAGLFSKLVEKTSFAVSEHIGRPAFSGILWELDSKKQKMVATDGKRLGKYETTLTLDTDKIDIIMPIKGVNLVRRIIHADQPKIKILPEESAISFEYDSYKIYSRLIEANYPDYEAVIPYDNSKLIDIEVEPLIKAIQRVSLLASEDNFKIIFNFSKNQLKIHSEDIDKGSAEEILEIENDFEKFQIGFNYKYLIEILQLVDTKIVQIKFENSLDPCIFYNIEYPEDQKNLFLLMPLRLAND